VKASANICVWRYRGRADGDRDGADPERRLRRWARTRAASGDYSNTRELGRILYTAYAIHSRSPPGFCWRHRGGDFADHAPPPETKYQNPGQQIKVQRNERVRVVKMKSEKKV